MDSEHTKVDFDEYADSYENLLKDQLAFFNGERSYFSEYKIKILRKLFPGGFGAILDFGSGIGLSLPYLSKYFSSSDIYASDISAASLAHISKNYSQVKVVLDDNVTKMTFDLILVATVLHHVEPKLRKELMKRLSEMLNPGGSVCIFEHNPYNPITRRMVSTCPFDWDAILLKPKESHSLISSNTDLQISHSGYTLFFPNFLRRLRFFEPALSWLPLGGQYYVIAKKPSAI
jgi:SAM-dependent methyltransferase